MKIKERALSLLLSMIMVLTFMPALTFAEVDEPSDADGTPTVEEVTEGGEEVVTESAKEEPTRASCSHEDALWEEGYEATCYSEGHIDYWYCDSCGMYFVSDPRGDENAEEYSDFDDEIFSIPKNEDAHPNGGDTFCYEQGEEPDCYSWGCKSYWYCQYCGAMFADNDGNPDLNTPYDEDDINIPPKHQLKHNPEAEGLFFAYGSFYTQKNEYWECEKCGDLFNDENGEQYCYYEDLLNNQVDSNEDTKGGKEILDEDYSIWTTLNEIDDAIQRANSVADSGNAGVALNNANAAKASAEIAKVRANAMMNKAKGFNELSDTYSKDLFLDYFQETVDRANILAGRADAVVAKANNLNFNGTPDGSLPKVKASKPKAAKKAITVKWKKLNKKQLKSGTTNIEVWVATDPNFTNIIATPTVGKKKSSKKIKGLQKGVTYYVKVRAIKNASGIKYVGPWSAVKKVKVKK